jgi:hypothetical protein
VIDNEDRPGPSWWPVSPAFAALKRLPVHRRRRASGQTTEGILPGGEPVPAAEQDGRALEALVSLISEAPVSPEIRAAAYRALAARPGVADLGETDGGRRMQIPVALGEGVMVIDPETARIRETSVWAPLTGGIAHTRDGMVTIDAEWTDHLPPE